MRQSHSGEGAFSTGGLGLETLLIAPFSQDWCKTVGMTDVTIDEQQRQDADFVLG